MCLSRGRPGPVVGCQQCVRHQVCAALLELCRHNCVSSLEHALCAAARAMHIPHMYMFCISLGRPLTDLQPDGLT